MMMNNATTSPCPTLLLVESSPEFQTLAKRAIEKGKIEVSLNIANDSHEAIEQLMLKSGEAPSDDSLRTRPDLILLDLAIPEAEAGRVLQTVRENEHLRRIPVIALATSEQERAIAISQGLGANSVMPKPTDLDHLAGALHDLVDYWFRVVALSPRGNWVNKNS